jgi:hypothetical protein
VTDDKLTWPERFARNVSIVRSYADGMTLRAIGMEHSLAFQQVAKILDVVGLDGSSRKNEAHVQRVQKKLDKLDADYMAARARLLRER